MVVPSGAWSLTIMSVTYVCKRLTETVSVCKAQRVRGPAAPKSRRVASNRRRMARVRLQPATPPNQHLTPTGTPHISCSGPS